VKGGNALWYANRVAINGHYLANGERYDVGYY